MNGERLSSRYGRRDVRAELRAVKVENLFDVSREGCRKRSGVVSMMG